VKQCFSRCFGCFLVVIVCLGFVPLVSCQEKSAPPVERPVWSVNWNGDGVGFAEWGCGGDSIYGYTAKSDIFEVWQWDRGILKQTQSIQGIYNKPKGAKLADEFTGKYGWMSCGKYIYYHHKPNAKDRAYCVFDFKMNKVVQRWPRDPAWWEPMLHPSRKGDWVAVLGKPEGGYTYDDHEKIRVGLVSPKADKLDWITTLEGKIGGETVGKVLPSDDGAYIAVAGWQHGAAVVDVAKKKVLWQKRPEHEVCFADVAFSPDNKLIYSGGGEGAVYGMKVQDGEIVSRWFATLSGKSEYGFRITTTSVSPDGRFVAAGTGPMGIVFLFSTKTGKLENMLYPPGKTGSTTLVTSFSPDSKHLAAFDGGRIMVWKMPEEKELKTADKKGEK